MSDVKIVGGMREAYPNFRFVVQVPGGISAGFSKCSELSMEVTPIEHAEGGSVVPFKYPGRAKVSDITLERGASKSKKFYEWIMQVWNITVAVNTWGVAGGTRGVGSIDGSFKRNVKVIQLDYDATAVRKWMCYGTWPTKFVAGSWDNKADEVLMETLTLAMDYFELLE